MSIMDTNKKENSEITVDDILKVLGPFGKFNIYNNILILIPVFLSGMYANVYNFESMDLEYRCAIPECSNYNNSFENFTIPRDHYGVLHKCLRYESRNLTEEFNVTSSDFRNTSDEMNYTSSFGQCTPQNFDSMKEIRCDSFEYLEDHSIVKEFNLACQDWKRSLVGTAHNAGFFFSTPITGLISDNFGRRLAMVLACVFNGVGIIRALVFNYDLFVGLEFLETALGGGLYAASFVLAMELVGPKHRVFVSLLINMVYLIGGVVVSLLHWWLQNWRYLVFVIYTPALFGFLYMWILCESFRWLLSQGKYEEAIRILKNSEKMNDVTVPKEYYEQIERNAIKLVLVEAGKSEAKQEQESYFKQLLKSAMIWKRLFTCSFLLITSTLVYFGLSINAIELSGNSYLNFVLMTLIEAPANVCKLLFLDTFGRKKVISIAFFLTGLILFIFAFVPSGIWSIVVYLGGKFFVTLAFNSLYVFAAEVFPTNYRTSLLALCLTIGRIGSALAPQTPLLMRYSAHLPTTLFGIMAIMSGFLVLTLPETNNQKLPDSLEEARELDLARNQNGERTKL